jgi:threonine/homoserine/homoserine lactone efflux protein
MTPGAFLTLTATVAVAAITPGPAVAAMVARAIADGPRPAMAINLGVVTGDLLFFAAATAGMAAAARSAGELFTIIRFLGAAYLLWQAVKLWRAPLQPVDGRPSGHDAQLRRNFAAGLLLMFGHVQAMLFYAALLPGFVNFGSLTATDVALLAAMLVVVIGGVNTVYVFAAARARHFFADERAQRAVHRTAASLMVVAAALVLTRV